MKNRYKNRSGTPSKLTKQAIPEAHKAHRLGVEIELRRQIAEFLTKQHFLEEFFQFSPDAPPLGVWVINEIKPMTVEDLQCVAPEDLQRITDLIATAQKQQTP